MSERTKTILRAPDGVTESAIHGMPYWPEERDDLPGLYVETAAAEHVKTLVQHGYEIVSVVSIMKPAAARGPIDTDEFGRSQLAAALTERGISYPLDADRAALADIAEAWNNSLRRRRFDARAENLTAEAVSAPPASRAAEAAAAALAAPESGPAAIPEAGTSTEYDDLKGWLVAHGIAFPANTPKRTLREMVENAHAELLKGKAAA